MGSEIWQYPALPSSCRGERRRPPVYYPLKHPPHGSSRARHHPREPAERGAEVIIKRNSAAIIAKAFSLLCPVMREGARSIPGALRNSSRPSVTRRGFKRERKLETSASRREMRRATSERGGRKCSAVKSRGNQAENTILFRSLSLSPYPLPPLPSTSLLSSFPSLF